ncbi:MAG: NTP transferase domain-containing protein [Steroidobacteraceae bacterium]
MSAPLHGLVLAGGRSSRMGRDKAALEYAGRSQLERAFALLDPLVSRCFVSVRADQQHDPLRARFPQIVDAAPGVEGPAAGILSALRAHPQSAWLVLACDLPFLDAGTLQHLIARRDPTRTATAFRSSHDGLPEPLCAIYEPAARSALEAFVAGGRICPRKFLIQSDALLLDQPRAESLDNVNTPTELEEARNRMSQPTVAARELRVQYFALLREQAGRRDEAVTTGAPTPRELFAELAARHGFTLAPEHLKVAVNSEFSDWSRPLAAGDHVVFIPPVAGG